MMIWVLLLLTTTEDVVYKTEQGIDFELILKDIEYMQNHPLDINRVGVEELARIPYLSLNDVIKIVEYREKHGLYRSLDDLVNVPGIDRALVEMISPFLTIGKKTISVSKIKARGRTQTKLPAEEPSLEYYTKMSVLFDEYAVYTVTERDPYERLFFDHYAAGLFIDEGKRKFAFGKYNLDLGAGAVLSPVGSFFRGIDFRIMLNERGLIPYTSTLENSGFFGAAFSDSLFLDYTLFYSNQKLDGVVDSLGFARSLDESGEHTDSLSASRKDRINEELLGFDLRYRTATFLIANRSYLCTYDPGFVTADSVAGFHGTDFFVTGVEMRYIGRDFVVFGEIARSWKNRFGGLFGVSAVLPFVDMNIAGKYFPSGFYSPKGIEVTPDLASGTLDLKHHSGIIDVGLSLTLDNKLREDTTKHDLKLSFAKRIGMLDARVNFRRRYRAEDVDLSGSEVLLRLMATRHVFFDLRFEERTAYGEEIESGIFVALEACLDLKNLDARVRYGIFDTDTYAARIYAYEIDLPGIVNNRMLYYKGHYGFLYVSFRPVSSIKFSLKYSAVKRDTISDRRVGGQIDFSL
jgi:hypothetical protein